MQITITTDNGRTPLVRVTSDDNDDLGVLTNLSPVATVHVIGEAMLAFAQSERQREPGLREQARKQLEALRRQGCDKQDLAEAIARMVKANSSESDVDIDIDLGSWTPPNLD